MRNKVALVVIGRNEGERLRRSLESVVGTSDVVVYVDSGSSDGSVALARGIGVQVLELDQTRPFSAARARNEGLHRSRQLESHLEYVQFLDGDCELAPQWLDKASAYLDAHPDVSVVHGRLREKAPEQSIYNMLCDMEWDAPAGETKTCGGIALISITALEAVGGYREDMVAGEEPELCVRLRANGWKIWRIDDDMAVHDAAMFRFSQWWTRCVRTGYAFAHGAALHGAGSGAHGVRESRSAWTWGLGIPMATAAVYAIGGSWALCVAMLYPLQIARLAWKGSRPIRQRWLQAFFLVLGKFPELIGQVKFRIRRRMGGPYRLIEYK